MSLTQEQVARRVKIDVLREKLGGIGQNQSAIEKVKVRCTACKTLNDETNKFCGECGQAL